MSVNLQKGQKISLVKPGEPGLKRIMVGLGWDEVGNLVHSSGAIVHQGDNLTGAGDGDDEQIMVDLPNIPANIDKLVFVVNIYDANVRHQHFGLIRNAFIRLVDLSTQKEICRFNLSDDYSGRTGLVVGEIYRHNGEWKFNAIGQGVTEASRLAELVRLYQ